MSGTLYLIPTNLCEPFSPATILPADVMAIASRLEYYVAENAKTARQFLKTIGTVKPIQEISIGELNEHTKASELNGLLAPLKANHDVGLISDAGAPGVADPGANLVALAHANNFRVVPCVGASSILLALMAGGLNGQCFAFHGYLPQDKAKRSNTILDLERESRQKNMTQLFIETPYRNQALLADLLTTLAAETRLSIACNLTAPDEFISTRKIQDWKNNLPDLAKKPTLFSFLA